MSAKILIALQFWGGDKEAAMKRARLIADLEPQLSTSADFMFSSRFDCTQSVEDIKHVSRKFQVHTHVNRRRGVGWPSGCNDLFFGTLDHVFTLSEAKRLPMYKAILFMESDSFPLHPGWIEKLSRDWDGAGAKVFGPLCSNGPHINGNCFISGDKLFLRWLARDKGGCSPHVGWDYHLYSEFLKWGAKDAPAMKSWWRIKDVGQGTFDELLSTGVSFLHGCKDDSVEKLVRRKFKV